MAFKIGDELIHMIGDFTNMNRSPDFKAKANENPQRAAKTRPGRQHSLNLAVGVSDEIPPFSEANTTTRRQSAGKIFQPFNNKRALSAPAHMREDFEQKKHGKVGKFPLIKAKSIGIDESDLEAVQEEEIDLLASTSNNGTESLINYKEISTSDNGDNNDNNNDNSDNDHTSVNPIILPLQSLHTKIINNVGHRGSIVLIDDDDDDDDDDGDNNNDNDGDNDDKI